MNFFAITTKRAFLLMKTIFFLTILIISLLFLSGSIFANSQHNHQSEIEEGKSLVESRVSCDELTDEQLEAIGDYLMEQMHPGQSHEAMHQMMGMEEGTEYHKRFHVNMAKTIYCGQNALMSIPTMGMMPMMGMMTGWSNPSLLNNYKNFMMNFGSLGAWNWFSWIFMILFWILIILGIVVLIKWLVNQLTGAKKEKSALDILKERYARGEISKTEFEEKKKDLS